MKKIAVIAALVSLCFATGFTCSKNAPEQTAQPTDASQPAQPTQEQMSVETAAPGTTEPGTAQPGTQAPGGIPSTEPNK